ncbi:Uncharacterised protein [Streptococcus pneumoniae]|nr:Uncharacterised protein [Streptococcus pneumoniae]
MIWYKIIPFLSFLFVSAYILSYTVIIVKKICYYVKKIFFKI